MEWESVWSPGIPRLWPGKMGGWVKEKVIFGSATQQYRFESFLSLKVCNIPEFPRQLGPMQHPLSRHKGQFLPASSCGTPRLWNISPPGTALEILLIFWTKPLAFSTLSSSDMSKQWNIKWCVYLYRLQITYLSATEILSVYQLRNSTLDDWSCQG